MRVLLTGGAGFIGSHVADHLLARGHEVAIVDDLSSGKRDNVPEGARFYELDIRGGCAEVFGDFEPEALCHQAAQLDVRRSVREPEFDASVNVLGTIRLLENCIDTEVRKVVFASTGGAVYGEQREYPATEEHPQYPISPYGVSKLAGERYLHYYHVQYGIPYAALRYANVYGPRQDPHGEAGVVAIFCGNLAADRTSLINGSGEQTRDYVYVYDLLVDISVKDLSPRHGPAKPGEQLRSSVDPSKLEQLLKWRPEIGLRDGLEQTLRFFGGV
jgi:UDP-glucose 4-epimerase